MSLKTPKLKNKITQRIVFKNPFTVWTSSDFLDLGSREAVDKTLQRLVSKGELRRIHRGLYDKPTVSSLTKKTTVPDYREVINAISQRTSSRMLIDGIMAANDLGLTDAVPARIVVYTDARLRPMHLNNNIIEFKRISPKKLYWAGRPAMRVVQALYWLKDLLPSDVIMNRLKNILRDQKYGTAICEDLHLGLAKMPIWMQHIVRKLLEGEK
jgi:hypothetical protein